MSTDIPPAALSLDEIAAALEGAEATRVPIAPPSTAHPRMGLAEAYAVQGINTRRRLEAGERIVGRKVGLTSLAMQQQLGVDQPDFGIITDAMVVGNGDAFDVSELIAPRVEAEFAFRIGRDLPPAPAPDELRAAIDGVSVALEIIDSRVADWKITLVDTVADNASSARIVTGPFREASPALLAELPATVVRLRRDDVEIGAGPGSAVLGDPLVSLHWLATAIGAFGDSFRAGDIVLAGAVSASVPLDPGVRWEARAEGFEPVVFTTTITTSGT